MPSVVAGHAGIRAHSRRRTFPTDQLVRSAAFAALLLVSPIFVVIAGLIVISSRGPALVKRPVSLCNGQFAYVTEFRTRPLFDPATYDQLPCKAKSRTAVGRVLHVTSLSRLPRLIDFSAGRHGVG